MKTELITYSLEIDDYMSDRATEDRYDVVRLEVWHHESGPELNSFVEYENCTLLQAVERIRQLTAIEHATTPARVGKEG